MSRCSGDYARSVKGDDSCPALEKLADSGVRTRGQCNAAEESASTSCSGVVELADRAGSGRIDGGNSVGCPDLWNRQLYCDLG